MEAPLHKEDCSSSDRDVASNCNIVDDDLDEEDEEQLRLELAKGLKISYARREEECVEEEPILEEKELIEGDIPLKQLLKKEVSYREIRNNIDEIEALVSLDYLTFGQDGWDFNSVPSL
jgi:hypothetical protein